MRLQRSPVLWCAGRRLLGWLVPPRARGMTWSMASAPGLPHMWQMSESRRMRVRSCRQAMVSVGRRVGVCICPPSPVVGALGALSALPA